MPRGARLTPAVEDIIARVCLEDPQLISKPKKVQEKVISRLPDSLKIWGGPNWPGVDAIRNRIKKTIKPNFENRPPEVVRLDTPWSIGTLAEYPIAPEAIPMVISAYKDGLSDKNYLTISEALWIGRLYKAVDPPVEELIREWAGNYAWSEKICWLQDKPFDSKDIDMEMIISIDSIREAQRYEIIWKIAEKYGADPAKARDLSNKFKELDYLSIDELKEIEKTGEIEKVFLEGLSVGEMEREIASLASLLKRKPIKEELELEQSKNQDDKTEKEAQNERPHSKEG